MSAVELQARIEQVSADIERQRETLKKLECSKITLQRQLNAVRDPVARLPHELSSEIFIQCLPPWPDPRAQHIAALLSNICHAWTSIALSTPALWATLRVCFPHADGSREFLQTRVQRARTQPLHLSLELMGPVDQDVLSVVWDQSEHLKSLRIFIRGVLVEEAEAGSHQSLFTAQTIIRSLRPGPLPFLTTLIIRCGQPALPCYWDNILYLLRLSLNLIDLTLINVDPVDRWFDDTAGVMVFPNLRRIRFGRDLDRIGSGSELLRSISAPRLETLVAPMRHLLHDHNDDITSFLRRSSTPPLHRLTLDFLLMHSDSSTADLFALTPTLTHLEICSASHNTIHDFFTILAQSPPLVLPDLQHLTLRDVHPPPPGLWDVVLQALSLRRTHLQTVHIVSAARIESLRMPPGTLEAFRALSADGLDISIAEASR